MSSHLSDLLDERQAAEYLKLTPRTLQAWRARGAPDGGPPLPHVRISARCIRYRRVDLEQFASERLRTSTSDDGSGDGPDLRVVGGTR